MVINMIKKIVSVIGFGFMLLLALSALANAGYISFLIFLVIAFWISPFSKFIKSSFVDSVLKRGLGVGACIFLFFAACAFFPKVENTEGESTDASNMVADAEETLSERIIAAEQENAEAQEESAENDQNGTEPSVLTEDSGSEPDGSETVSVVEPTENADNSDNDANSQQETADEPDNSDISSQDQPTNSTTVSEQSVDPVVTQSVAQTPDQPDTTSTATSAVTQAQNGQSENNNTTPSNTMQNSPDTSGNSGGSSSNFNTYDNQQNHQTTEMWVLNTNTMKIHQPSCSSVSRISPENYATSSLTLEELRAKGYTTCGNCFR